MNTMNKEVQKDTVRQLRKDLRKLSKELEKNRDKLKKLQEENRDLKMEVSVLKDFFHFIGKEISKKEAKRNGRGKKKNDTGDDGKG